MIGNIINNLKVFVKKTNFMWHYDKSGYPRLHIQIIEASPYKVIIK